MTFTPIGGFGMNPKAYAQLSAILVQREIVRLHDEGLSTHEIAAEFGFEFVAGNGPYFQVINFVIERTEAARERGKHDDGIVQRAAAYAKEIGIG